MPHITVEYTENIGAAADIPGLLRKMVDTVLGPAGGGAFPAGGVKARAYEAKDYVVGDGRDEAAAFVHILIRVAAGRPLEVRQKAFGAVFEVVKDHLGHFYDARPFAISMDVEEFGERMAYKHNNLHERYKGG
jgi:5-carboxymethyl-2-hydroxymuconate isomerase